MQYKFEKIKIKDDNGVYIEAIAPLIISASRVTDIPSFYSDWFFEKLKKVSGKNYFLIKIPFGLMLMVAYLVVLLHKLNKKYEPPFTPAHIRKFNYNWQTSLNKAIQELGYEVTPFEKALKETIDLFTLYK